MPDYRYKIVPVSPHHLHPLKKFFGDIKDNKFFQPHPFDDKMVLNMCFYEGQDLYYVIERGQILCYGFLRGWDAGWDDICLGISTHPTARKLGLGELMMNFLHFVGRQRGLLRIRLHVSPDNEAAVNLYKKTGYKFSGDKYYKELIGYRKL